MRFAVRPTAVLVGMLCLSATASAGPLPWGFQVFDSTSGLDVVQIQRGGLGVGEYREPVLTRPVLDPHPPLPNPGTIWSDNYSVYDQNVHKVRVWMGTDDYDHDQWRSVTWAVSRRYKKTADGAGWVLDRTDDFFGPTNPDGRWSVMEFDNGDPDDRLVNRVELWNENGTAVFRMTPDVAPSVPEPATLALAAVGLGAVGLRRAVRVDRTRRAG